MESIAGCCGIHELDYIIDDEGPEHSLMRVDQDEVRAHVIFSDTSSNSRGHHRGKKLAELIKKHKLGAIVETRGAKNNHHTGTLKAWLWTPNHKRLKAWQDKMRKKHPEQFGRSSNSFYDPYVW